MPIATPSRPYSLGFWLMCLSSFLFFLSFNLLLPKLPDHLTRLGGGEYKGLGDAPTRCLISPHSSAVC